MTVKGLVLCGLTACAVSGCSSFCPPSADVDPVEAAWAARANVPRERIEWVNVWIEDAEKPMPKRVLLIGDSIVGNYFPAVSKLLAGKAACMKLHGSRCVGDPVLLQEAKVALSLYKFDVIHVNNGLHGFGTSDEDYARFLPQYLDYLHRLQPQAKIVWARTTDVHPTDYKNYETTHARIVKRNAAADAAVKERGYPVTDLYALSNAHPEYHVKDGCHFSAEGGKALAEAVAASIEAALK